MVSWANKRKRGNSNLELNPANIVKPPWIVYPYNSRRLTRKIDDALKEIRSAKADGDWIKASRLQWILRNAWWGFKRYKK